MAHPLELAYNWRTPALFASVGAVVCLGVVLRGDAAGKVGVAVVLVVLWAGCLTLVWARTRAHLEVDGARLTVRRVRALHTVDAGTVVAVRQQASASGPVFALVCRDADGGTRRVVAPVALLRGGTSTLFRWILAHAPQAELDRGSRRTVEQLQTAGLLP
ncbi:hypothetical protein SAMN04488543_4355 [Friedmanniella luteola]|uniref:PH domain-containing protein n=1 Tax=Friedmanniella luteola TaxID=546871 RepID=A0A1H2ABM3_9ACTN|nr:hypothetical protein [Friedmanniella luteola]SDT43152.1 hypothetical protein SAMN04488543_4355 [Friedmanniella luteola]